MEELISAFADLGIEMDKTEATKLLQRYFSIFSFDLNKFYYKNRLPYRMDQDGSLNISFDEWRDFLLLAPSTDILGLIKFWRHSTVSFTFIQILFNFVAKDKHE